MESLYFVKHYLSLLRQHWKLLIFVTLIPTVFVLLYSVVQLNTSPKYTSTSSITLLPSDNELEFAKKYSGGTRKSQNNTLNSTYKEYLKSKPVITAAMKKVIPAQQISASDPTTQQSNALEDALIKSLKYAAYLYNTINSGRYNPSSEEDRAFRRIQKSIKLSSVEGTFILNIEASHSDRNVAADLANALAEVYVNHASVQAKHTANRMKEHLEGRIQQRQAEYDALQNAEFVLRQKLGILALETEKDSLRNSLDRERAGLSEDRLEAAQIVALTDLYSGKRENTRNRADLENLSREIELNESRGIVLEHRIAVRTASIAAIIQSIKNVAAKEEPLIEINQKKEILKDEIDRLRAPIGSLELAGSEQLSGIRTINPALPSRYPSSPKVVLNGVKGLALGLLIAIAALVIIDLKSDKIKTLAELQRLTNRKPIGVIAHPFVKSFAQNSSPLSKSDIRKLRVIGADLEKALSLNGGFDGTEVYVTGFAPSALVEKFGLVFGAALADYNNKIYCRVSDPSEISLPKSPAFDKNLTLIQTNEQYLHPDTLTMTNLGGLVSKFKWNTMSRECPGLICIVNLGYTERSDIENFLAMAARVGKVSPLFVAAQFPTIGTENMIVSTHNSGPAAVQMKRHGRGQDTMLR